jgi:multicomponent Na+:H+ antiporter subunit A
VVQRGSASAYLSFILLVVIVLPGSALLGGLGGVRVKLWDTPWQAVVGLVVVLAAVAAVRSRRRLRAVLLAGATGYGTAVFFVFHGAPDLALTQVLVETLALVVFVLALRRLPEYFTDRPLTRRRYWRMVLGFGVALTVAGFLVLGVGSGDFTKVSEQFPPLAKDYGGGINIVNVILVDTRAWDTLGEISVLVAAATGVASLVFIDARSAGIRRVHEIPYPTDVVKQPTKPGRRAWLPAPRTLSPERRSIIFEVITRLLFHSIMVFSIYLLLAGHNAPGGGFAGGMVAGLALVIRYLAGGRYELDEAAPVDAGHVIGWGLFVAVASALLPMLFGAAALQSAIVDIPVPLLGEVHVVTSALFDIGVYLVVVGLVLDLLRALGSQIDRQVVREQRQRTEGSGVTS